MGSLVRSNRGEGCGAIMRIHQLLRIVLCLKLTKAIKVRSRRDSPYGPYLQGPENFFGGNPDQYFMGMPKGIKREIPQPRHQRVQHHGQHVVPPNPYSVPSSYPQSFYNNVHHKMPPMSYASPSAYQPPYDPLSRRYPYHGPLFKPSPQVFHAKQFQNSHFPPIPPSDLHEKAQMTYHTDQQQFHSALHPNIGTNTPWNTNSHVPSTTTTTSKLNMSDLLGFPKDTMESVTPMSSMNLDNSRVSPKLSTENNRRENGEINMNQKHEDPSETSKILNETDSIVKIEKPAISLTKKLETFTLEPRKNSSLASHNNIKRENSQSDLKNLIHKFDHFSPKITPFVHYPKKPKDALGRKGEFIVTPKTPLLEAYKREQNLVQHTEHRDKLSSIGEKKQNPQLSSLSLPNAMVKMDGDQKGNKEEFVQVSHFDKSHGTLIADISRQTNKGENVTLKNNSELVSKKQYPERTEGKGALSNNKKNKYKYSIVKETTTTQSKVPTPFKYGESDDSGKQRIATELYPLGHDKGSARFVLQPESVSLGHLNQNKNVVGGGGGVGQQVHAIKIGTQPSVWQYPDTFLVPNTESRYYLETSSSHDVKNAMNNNHQGTQLLGQIGYVPQELPQSASQLPQMNINTVALSKNISNINNKQQLIGPLPKPGKIAPTEISSHTSIKKDNVNNVESLAYVEIGPAKQNKVAFNNSKVSDIRVENEIPQNITSPKVEKFETFTRRNNIFGSEEVGSLDDADESLELYSMNILPNLPKPERLVMNLKTSENDISNYSDNKSSSKPHPETNEKTEETELENLKEIITERNVRKKVEPMKKPRKEDVLNKLFAIAGDSWEGEKPPNGDKKSKRKSKFKCPKPDGYFSDPIGSCFMYYRCVHGKATSLKCGKGLRWNTETEQCDWGTNVQCA